MNAALFDLDGLLVDSEPLWFAAMQAVLGELGVDVDPVKASQCMGMRVDAGVQFWYDTVGWEGPSPPEVKERITRYIMRDFTERGQPKPGVRSVLEFFREERVPMAVASSAPPEYIQHVLDGLGITGYFDLVYSAEHEPQGKPHPGVYLTAARRLGVPPAACVVFEDSVVGVQAAAAAGMVCVCVPEPHMFNDPRIQAADYVLHSLVEFDAALWEEISHARHPRPGGTDSA